MHKTLFAAAVALTVICSATASASPAAYVDPLDAATLNTIKLRFGELMELANRHDLKSLHSMFWQSPSALLVAKSAIPSEGNWAGFWGNEAIDQKLHDIAASGPVVLSPDYAKLKVVGLTHDIAESYVPMNIIVSYAGQDGLPRPFLMIVNWIKIEQEWKVASEIILPVPPTQPTSAGSHAGTAAIPGQDLYRAHCSSCHQINGEGLPGVFPPLKGSGVVNRDDARKHIRAVLYGIQGGRAGGVTYASAMPPFAGLLSDADIAGIIDYERGSWGNHGKPVTPTEVSAERSSPR